MEPWQDSMPVSKLQRLPVLESTLGSEAHPCQAALPRTPHQGNKLL